MSLLDIVPGGRAAPAPITRRPRNIRIVSNPGLSAFAREQGVHVTHAYRVVMGDRQSHRLFAAWEAFKARQAADSPSS